MPNLEKPTRNCVCPENGRVAWCPRFIHLDETIGSWEFTFEHFYDDDSKGSAAWLVAPNTVKAFIEGQIERATEEGGREKREQHLGIGKGGDCVICGGQTALIRGRVPKSDKRRVCPTCLKEKMENIQDLTSDNYGLSSQQ